MKVHKDIKDEMIQDVIRTSLTLPKPLRDKLNNFRFKKAIQRDSIPESLNQTVLNLLNIGLRQELLKLEAEAITKSPGLKIQAQI